MSIDTSKPVKRILFNGTELPIEGATLIEPVLIEKEITANGSYIASEENADGYSSINVNVVSKEPTLIAKEITANGTYIASEENVDGYSVIQINVAGGSGNVGEVTTGKYVCRVVDYDGTILKEEFHDAGEVFIMPNIPTHDRLVFQEWTTPVDIVNNQVTVGNSDLIFGAVYTTSSGLSEFDIQLTRGNSLDVVLNLDGTKDWGDGTSNTETTHTYTDYGKYTITCDGSTMTTSSSSGLFGQKSGSSNYYCTGIRLGNNLTNIGEYAFIACCSLTNITIPTSVTSIERNSLYGCGLINIAIPTSVTSIGAFAFGYCYSLVNVSLPNSVTSISNSLFRDCYSLTNITIPTSVTSIGEYAFNSCYHKKNYYFTDFTTVPILTSMLGGLPSNLIGKIIVPDNLYDEWIAATNWIYFAARIYKASEVTE